MYGVLPEERICMQMHKFVGCIFGYVLLLRQKILYANNPFIELSMLYFWLCNTAYLHTLQYSDSKNLAYF